MDTESSLEINSEYPALEQYRTVVRTSPSPPPWFQRYVFYLFKINSFKTQVPIIKNQSFDLLCKLMDWGLYHRDLRH